MRRMKLRWIVLAVISALLGVWMTFIFTPMKFCGALLLACAVFFLLWGFLDANRDKKPLRILRRILGGLVAVGLCIFTVFEAMVISGGYTDDETPVSAVVVLGAGVNGRTPSLSLRVRLEAALDYVQDKPDIPIVVSGAQGPGEGISEAQCMAEWLIDNGVEEERILLEDKATDTLENIRYSLEMLEENGVDTTEPIAVVTADYHLRRAAHYWGKPGMVPVAAHMPNSFFPLTINYYVREAFALAAAMLIPGQ